MQGVIVIVIIMTAKMFVILLLTSLTGVCPQRPRKIHVKAGEMVELYCPHDRGYNHGDANVIWTSYTTQEMDLTNLSSDEQRQMDVLVHGRSLVILSASVKHRGNYSCSLRNASSQFWFRLMICSTQREKEEGTQYPQTCFAQEACTMHCPDVNTPAVSTSDITSKGIIWHKEGESLPKDNYFSSVEENDGGVYTCTRLYLSHDEIYNMTFAVVLKVQPKEKTGQSVIFSPHKSDVFHVDLGSTVVIDCKAVMYSEFDEVFWFSGKSVVETNNSFPVFYNNTQENNAGELKITASLVFKMVSEEDLSQNYTCRLQSVFGHSSSVTITMAPKSFPSSLPLALGIVAVVVVVMIVLTVVVYMKLKTDIALFLRGNLCCYRSTSDGKRYDAFLMCYKSDTDAGLNEYDRKWLESVLEEKFGYSLCLYDRDVLSGKAVAEAVLDCVEQSRAVVLVPTSSDLGPGSGLLSAIHAALVEQQTRLVFIQTETTEVSGSGSLPDALQLLGETGDCVMWKGISSMPPSSSFWKQLRYYLPAPQHAPNTRLLPLIATQDDNYNS